MRYFSVIGVMCFVGILSSGCCSREPDKKPGDTSGGINDVINYATGETPIKQGEAMKKDIRRIRDEHEKQLEDVMKETSGEGQ